MTKIALTHDRLLSVLQYNPATGKFTWLKRISIRIRIGEEAGFTNLDGYIEIGIDNQNYQAHRLAWFYMTGKWPSAQIDHKNTIKSDTTWENLREATHGQNVDNVGLRANNSSGVKGVSFLSKSKKWHARIMHKKTLYRLGDFATKEQARIAYIEKAKELKGEFMRLV